MLAAKESRTEVVSLLLEAGANIGLIVVSRRMHGIFGERGSEHTMTVYARAILAYLQLALWNHES